MTVFHSSLGLIQILLNFQVYIKLIKVLDILESCTKQREPSFFLIKKTSVVIKDFKGFILPIQRFSAINMSSSNYFVRNCQMWFALEGGSPQSWLRHAQSVETSCDELSDVDLLERPWPQLMCCASYKPCGCNFREWSCKEL